MSKKHNQKKKVNVKVNPGQAIYVADISTLQHIASTYEDFAKSFGSSQGDKTYEEIARSVREWSVKTYYNPSSESEDEEW